MTAQQLDALPITESFNGSSTSISNFNSKWSALGWAGGSTPKGAVTTSGWRPVDAHPTINGAHYSSTFSDTGAGVAAVATMATNPGLTGRFFSLWLDMPTPSSTRAGYELRFSNTAASTYQVTLARWIGGAESVLASKSGYTFVNGNSFAIADQGGTVSAWTNTGSGFAQLLSASDSAFSGGAAGLHGAGNNTRLVNFKAGGLGGDTQPPDTAISSGPPPTTGSSSISFSFSATEEGSTFECALNGSSFSACSSPKTYDYVTDGAHSFQVRAKDPAGNQDQSPAERAFRANTAANDAFIPEASFRYDPGNVSNGMSMYNYAPSMMLDNSAYRMWWCAGNGGGNDYILHAESASLAGGFRGYANGNIAYDISFGPSGIATRFDGTHVCDPSVIKVGGTFYMYYGGTVNWKHQSNGYSETEIGLATSTDGVNWTRANNGNPVIAPRASMCACYGAGQPSAAYRDGYFYVMHTDHTGIDQPFQYVLRSKDPTFQTGAETATASGFAPLTAQNKSSYTVSAGYNVDMQFAPNLNAWLMIYNVHGEPHTRVRVMSKDFTQMLRPEMTIKSSHSEGPGLVSTPDKSSVSNPGECQRIKLDFVQSVSGEPSPANPPNNLRHFGGDVLTGPSCKSPASQVAFVDADNADTISYWNRGIDGWQYLPLWGHKVAPGTRPVTLNVGGTKHIYYVDATRNNQITGWILTPTGWQQTPLSTSPVAAGSSLSGIVFNGMPQLYFADASNNNTITVMAYGAGGWVQSKFYGDSVAANSSPSAVAVNGQVEVYFVSANKGNTMAKWTWGSTLGQTFYYQHAVAANTSPSAIEFNGASQVYFVDATDGNTISAWLPGKTAPTVFSLERKVAANTSPSAIANKGEVHVYYVDADDNTITAMTWGSQLQWTRFHGDTVASNTSPAAVSNNGTPQVFFSDASTNSMAYWEWGYSIRRHRLFGHAFKAGTSPGP